MNSRGRRRDSSRGDDYRDPTSGIGGASPARSALKLRAALAVFGLLVCAGAAALLAVVQAPTAWVVALAVLALIACVDLAVIGYRMRSKKT